MVTSRGRPNIRQPAGRAHRGRGAPPAALAESVRHSPDHAPPTPRPPYRAAGFEQSTEMLVNYLMGFLRLTRRQRIELRNRVERLGELFDWSNLVRHYDEAHNLALERVGARRMGTVEIKLV